MMTCLMAYSHYQHILITSNDFWYSTKQFTLQDFPHHCSHRSIWCPRHDCTVHDEMCLCMCELAGEREKEKAGGGRKESERELPDLKRQIRASLKSITGEPCTDFIRWKCVQLKGCKRILTCEIDWSLLFSKNVHNELPCRVCFGFVCLLSTHSVLNTSLPLTFYLKKLHEKRTQFSFHG